MQSADLSRRFQEVLAAYLEAKERGERVDAQALLRAHPDLAAELNEFFANEKQFASVAGTRPAPTPTRTGQQVGDYDLLVEIARGGMGVVYRARHRSLQRLVAMKMMLGGEFAGREGLRRFIEEAKLVAELDHPHIVPIYDTGAHNGQAFYCMKLIEGPSLKEQMGWYVGKPKAAARLIIQVARAVHHAHQRGILHRDLKPGNVLLQTASGKKAAKEYPISGIPGVPRSAIFDLHSATAFVTDFGLAKRFHADGEASNSTAVVGTAAYMAPEQANTKETLTVAADVYSLGAILYELLTGRKPFTGDNPMEVLLKVIEVEPTSPAELQPGIDPDLAQICLKCLRKKPAERYGSAEALAVELEQWLAGEALTVRAPTMLERAWRWCRRRPLAAALLVMLILLIATSVGLNAYLSDLTAQLKEAQDQSLHDALRLREQHFASLKLADHERLQRIALEEAKAARDSADAARDSAEAAKKKAAEAERLALKDSRRLLVQHYLGNGQQILQRGDLYGSAIWFAKALEHEPEEPMHRIRLGATQRQCAALEQIWFCDDKVRSARLSPIGDRLLLVSRTGSASLWDTKTGRQLGDAIRHGDFVNVAEFSPDGKYVVTAGADGSARLWLASTGAPHGNALKHGQSILSASFSHDGSKLATASTDRTARVWKVATTEPIGNPLRHDHDVRLVAFHPDGKKLLTLAQITKKEKGEIHVWDLAGQKAYFQPWSDKKGILDAGFSRDGRRIFAVNTNHKIQLWDAAGKPINLAPAQQVKGEQGAWFSPGIDRFVLPGESEIKLIDLPSGSVAHTIKSDGPILFAGYSPGGRFVAQASANGSVRLYRADSAGLFCPPLPHPVKVSTLAFSGNDQRLATVADDNIVRLWNLAAIDGHKVAVIPKARGTLLTGSPDGRFALVALPKATALWDIERGQAVGAALPAFTSSLLTRWSPDGKSVALATPTDVRAWEVPSGKTLTPTKELATWGKKMFEKKAVKATHLLDCDGQRLAVWKAKGTLEIQDVSGAMAKTLKLAVVPDVFRFSPDQKHGAAGFADGSLRTWDLTDGKPATPPFWHGEPIRQIAYSADGRLLASAGASGRIRVWEAATGQAISGDLTADGALVDLAFSADAGTLVAWSSEGRLRRWSLQPQPGSAAELLVKARLAAGQDVDAATGVLVPLDAAALKELTPRSDR